MWLRLALLTSLSGCNKLLDLEQVSAGADTDGGRGCQAAICDAPPPPRLLIAELSVAGLDDTCTVDLTDEFVELFNPEPVDASTAGLQLECAPADGTGFVVCAELPAAVVPAHGFYLIGGLGLGGQSCGVTNPPRDAALSASLDEASGAVRLVGGGRVIDRVAWGPHSGGEGSPVSPWPPSGWSTTFNSIERKASAASTAGSMANGGSEEAAGNGYDSDDNSTDFVFRSGRLAQNAMSAPEP